MDLIQRSSRSSGRPTASSKPSFNPSGTRSAHTQATPPPFAQQHQPQPQPQYAPQSSGGGFMSNVMSTAAGVRRVYNSINMILLIVFAYRLVWVVCKSI